MTNLLEIVGVAFFVFACIGVGAAGIVVSEVIERRVINRIRK